MTEHDDSDTAEWLRGLDAPRPLPGDARARIEDELLAAAPRRLDEALSERLHDALADPIAPLMNGIDAPRPLPDETRMRISAALERRAPRRHAFLGAAAAAMVAIAGVGIGLAVAHHGAGPSGSSSALRAPHTPASTDHGTLGSAGVQSAPGAAPSDVVPTGSASQGAGSGTANSATNTPAVLSISPSSGPPVGGTWVTVTGSDFADVTAVDFGTRPAATFVVLSVDELRALAPAQSAGTTVDLTVTSDSYSSALTPADRYSYSG
ncbi:MAG: IPT/TIG domain-containing protein [Acidimicrobiales bacterium]